MAQSRVALDVVIAVVVVVVVVVVPKVHTVIVELPEARLTFQCYASGDEPGVLG